MNLKLFEWQTTDLVVSSFAWPVRSGAQVPLGWDLNPCSFLLGKWKAAGPGSEPRGKRIGADSVQSHPSRRSKCCSMELGALAKVSDSEAQRNVRHPAERAQRARQRAVHRDAAHSARGPQNQWGVGVGFKGRSDILGSPVDFGPAPIFLKGTPRRPGACACFSTISRQNTVYSLREPNVSERLVNPRDEGFFPFPSQIHTRSQQGLPQTALPHHFWGLPKLRPSSIKGPPAIFWRLVPYIFRREDVDVMEPQMEARSVSDWQWDSDSQPSGSLAFLFFSV